MSASSPRKKATPGTPTEPLGDFRYTTEDGKEIVLPPWKSAKPGVLRKVRKLSMPDQFFTVLENLLEVRHDAAFDKKREELLAGLRANSEDPSIEPEIDDDDVEKELDEDPTIDIIDEMDVDDFQDFQRKWFKHSGIDLGE